LVAVQCKLDSSPLVISLGPALKERAGAAGFEFTVTVVDWLAVPPGPLQMSV
jgi:hypothetical protein